MKKKISIITITYNSSKVIEKFIKSIINSNIHVYELIIIENSSADKLQTKNICEKFRDKVNIKFRMSKNNGFGKSCNLGAKISTGDLLLFLNPDTELFQNSLEILRIHMDTAKANLIGGKSLNYHNKVHLTVVRKPNLNIGLFEFSNLGKLFHTQVGHNDFYYRNDKNIVHAKNDVIVDALGGAYLMVDRKSFIKLGGFDEKFFMYLEDVDFSIRAKKLNMRVVYCPHSIINHVGGASSDNKYKIRHQAWFDSRKYYYKKHFNFFINVIIQPLYTIEEYLLKRIKNL